MPSRLARTKTSYRRRATRRGGTKKSTANNKSKRTWYEYAKQNPGIAAAAGIGTLAVATGLTLAGRHRYNSRTSLPKITIIPNKYGYPEYSEGKFTINSMSVAEHDLNKSFKDINKLSFRSTSLETEEIISNFDRVVNDIHMFIVSAYAHQHQADHNSGGHQGMHVGTTPMYHIDALKNKLNDYKTKADKILSHYI